MAKDNMHMSDKSPFKFPVKGSSKFGSSAAAKPSQANRGAGKFISANASMKKKRPMNGAGTA